MPKSYKQVLAQIQKLQKEAEAIRSKEVQGVISRIKEAIAHYGLTPDDLFGRAGGRKSKATPVADAAGRPPRKAAAKAPQKPARPPKYRDEAGNTWSGIGKRPDWFKAALASGKSADELLIRG